MPARCLDNALPGSLLLPGGKTRHCQPRTGDRRWLELTLTPYRDDAGRVTYFIGMLSHGPTPTGDEITAVKAAQDGQPVSAHDSATDSAPECQVNWSADGSVLLE